MMRPVMLSFRIDAAEAARVQHWADHLGIDRSELLRDAIRRRIDALVAEREALTWTDDSDLERDVEALGTIADWGPSEDWSDWADAEG
jgi:hypothetical protein